MTKQTLKPWREYAKPVNWHEAATIFPTMSTEELTALAADIKTNGQRNPTILLDGKVLDGRNRILACAEADVEPSIQTRSKEEIGSPVSWVLSQNIHRRQLTPSQRAMIAVEAEKLFAAELKEKERIRKSKPTKEQVPESSPTPRTQARDMAAKASNVNPRYVSAAKKLLKASPSLARQVRAGEISLPSASKHIDGETEATGRKITLGAAAIHLLQLLGAESLLPVYEAARVRAREEKKILLEERWAFVREGVFDMVGPNHAEGVVSVLSHIYCNHPLPSKHFRGKNPFGKCDYWAFAKDGEYVGFAVMRHDGKTVTLRRLIVEPSLPKEEHIAVGRALVKEMCNMYPIWTSTTDVEQEAPHYHDLYKVKGVTQGKPKGKEAPQELKGIPLPIQDWRDTKKCVAFLESHTQWHNTLIDNATKMGLGRFLRPAGRKLTPLLLQHKLQDARHAGRVLSRLCPTTQITYSWHEAVAS